MGYSSRRNTLHRAHALHPCANLSRKVYRGKHVPAGSVSITEKAGIYADTHESSFFACCQMQIRNEAQTQGTLLPDYHPYVKLIKQIGTRIAQKASDDTGVSGHMEHMKVSC